MNYKLVKIIPDGNGVKDKREDIAISTDKEKLSKYCKTTFGKEIEESQNSTQVKNFSWDGWYVIIPSNIVIL